MAEEAGEVKACPQCGAEVKLHSMIPVLDGEGPGHRYLCRDCARTLIPAEDGEPAASEGAGSEGAGDDAPASDDADEVAPTA